MICFHFFLLQVFVKLWQLCSVFFFYCFALLYVYKLINFYLIVYLVLVVLVFQFKLNKIRNVALTTK